MQKNTSHELSFSTMTIPPLTSKYNYLVRYTYSDFVGSIDDRKITSRYAFHMAKGLISRASKK